MMPAIRNVIGLMLMLACTNAQTPKQDQLAQFMVDTNGQVETTYGGVQANTTYSLRAGPRGFVLLEDTLGRQKIQHFDKERQPERVVHALGHGAYGTFESAGDFSQLTDACWLKKGQVSDVFTRFSVVVASVGGSESNRDTHGFATKIYSECGNHDFVGNSLTSFFINDGILFPDLIHAVKYEANLGFPTSGTAHTTAWDFFTQRTEGSFQLLNVVSDLGLPRDPRHMGGAGVHTYRFINAAGNSTLFKWYWNPQLGYRSLVYDEVQQLVGKNANFQRVDLYNSIEAGLYPKWDFMVQTFPDDGTYTYKGYDLLDSTIVIPFELNPPTKMGTLTLNRNPTNFFSEPENIQFSPATVVKGVAFVPDPLLAWRLMSYDDAAPHRHGSANFFDLPVNRPVTPVNNNFRDGYMQPFLFEGDSTSSPNNIGGVIPASQANTFSYGDESVNGKIGRYGMFKNYFSQATIFYSGLDQYAQQHLVDGLRFELGNVANQSVSMNFITRTLNNINNCLARRVAYGIGLPMPAAGMKVQSNGTTYPSQYPLGNTARLPVTGLKVGIISDATGPSPADVAAIMSVFGPLDLFYDIIGTHMGKLSSGVNANQSYITTSSVFYDAIIVATDSTAMYVEEFIRDAYGHGKPIGSYTKDSTKLLRQLGFNGMPGVFSMSSAAKLASQIVTSLMSPGRYFQRNPSDDVASICGS